jgi:hypothetical protein
MKATNIKWVTDGEDVNLPSEVEIPQTIAECGDDAITDYLSDSYGFLVEEYALPMDNDDRDFFGEEINRIEGKVS